MLQKIRDNASGWLIKTILWSLVAAFVGTIFLVWGHGGETGQQPVATVGDFIITNSDYQDRYRSMTDRLRDSMGRDVDDDIIRSLQLDKQALDSLIMEKLVYIAAEEAGLRVSDEELKYAIANNPNFQTDGRFDKDRYFSILRTNELAPRHFEKNLMGDLLISKISRIIADSVYVTEGEAKEEFVKRNETEKARYMILSAALFEGSVDLSEEVVSRYYDRNKIPYTRPEERKIEYLFSGYESFSDEIEISEVTKKAYYDTHQDDYETEEKIRARHILLSTPPNLSEEEAAKTRERAENLMKEIAEGADFAEMAKKHSDGPTKDVGGDLGIFGRGTMLPEFEEVAFSMSAGDVSTPVRTRFGWHIIKVEERLEAKLREYEDVSLEIEIAIAKKKGEVMAKNAITRIARDKEKAAGSWNELADSKNIVYKETGIFRGEPVPGVSDSAAIVKRAFDMATGDRAGPLELKNGFYLIRLLDVVPPRERELAEVRSQVEEKMKKEQSKRIARETADKILARLRDGESFGDVAKDMGLGIKETGEFKRRSEIKGIPGASFSRRAFKLKVGEFDVTLVGDKNYIMELLGKNPPDDADFEKEKNDIMQALKRQKDGQAVSLWRLKLRDDAHKNGLIIIEPGFI